MAYYRAWRLKKGLEKIVDLLSDHVKRL